MLRKAINNLSNGLVRLSTWAEGFEPASYSRSAVTELLGPGRTSPKTPARRAEPLAEVLNIEDYR